MSGPEHVNQATAEAATNKAELPLHSLQLLGIVTRGEEAQALLRRPDGGTFWARKGSQTNYGTVIAIDETTLILRTATSKRRLSL